jgi:hypothetical protein
MHGGDTFTPDRGENAPVVVAAGCFGRGKKTQPSDESQFTNSSTHPQLELCDKNGTFRRQKNNPHKKG